MNNLQQSPTSNSDLLLVNYQHQPHEDEDFSRPIVQDFGRPQTSAQQLQEIRDQVESDQKRVDSYQSQQLRRPTSPDSKSSQFNLNQVEQERLFKVRRSFQQALNKLSSNDTKEVGLNECKKIIEQNSDQSSLRVYLSLLCEKHKNSTTSNKELQVLLFGYLAKIYKTDMLDPLDKPPNLLKTIVRICESIHSFLKENSSLIHLACANSLVDLFDNCFISKEDKLSLSLIFYEPLAAVINGGYDKMGQMAASICILKLLEYLIENKHEAFYDFLCPKFVQLFIVKHFISISIFLQKTKCDHPDFLACMQLIIQHSSLKYCTQYIWEIVQRNIKIVESPDTQAYLRKIEACNLLKAIAINLKDVADLIMGYMHRQVIKSLETGQCDRVLKVRQAAIQAKQQWQQVKFINKEIEEKKQNEELQGLSPDEIIQARTGYANVDDVRKQVLQEAQNDLEVKQRPRPQTAVTKDNSVRPGSSQKFKMLKELARLNQELRVQKPYSPTAQEKKILAQEQNWSAAHRANKFLKRGVGIGGGQIPGLSSERNQQKIGSHNVQRQSIKDLILEHMKNKNLSPKDLEMYMKDEGNLKDILKLQYDAELQQYQNNQDPEYQAIDDRVKSNRQKLALKQGSGSRPTETQNNINSNSGKALDQNVRSPKFQTQSILKSPKHQSQISQQDEEFGFEEAKVGSGDQSMPNFGGMLTDQRLASQLSHPKSKVAFQEDQKNKDFGYLQQDYSKQDSNQNPIINYFERQNSLQDHNNQSNNNDLGMKSNKQDYSDNQSIMNEELRISDSTPKNKEHQQEHANQELLNQLKQGKTVAEMDQKEIQRLSEKIIKEALNEDSGISQLIDKSSISQQLPQFTQQRRASQLESQNTIQQQDKLSSVPHTVKQSQNSSQLTNPFENDQQKRTSNNNLNQDGDFFEEPVMSGGDQAFNPFSSQNDVPNKQRTKSSIINATQKSNVIELVPQDQSLLKQKGIPTTQELQQIYKPKPQENQVQYQDRIKEIQKTIVKEQAPQLIQRIQGHQIDEDTEGNKQYLKGQGLGSLIEKQEKDLKEKYDIPTKQELKTIYRQQTSETPLQYENRLNKLQQDIIQQQAPHVLKQIINPTEQLNQEKAIESFINQNESQLKSNYQIPTQQDLKQVFPQKLDETRQQYEQRITQKQKQIIQEQAPNLIQQIKQESSESSDNLIQQIDPRVIESFIEQNENVLKQQYQIPNKSDLEQVYPMKSNETLLNYQNRIADIQKQIVEEKVPQLLQHLQTSQARNHSQISGVNQNPFYQEKMGQINKSFQEEERDASITGFIKQNEQILKQSYDVPTTSELKSIYKPKQNETQGQYDSRISDIQKSILQTQAPQVMENIKQSVNQNQEQDQVSFRPGQNFQGQRLISGQKNNGSMLNSYSNNQPLQNQMPYNNSSQQDINNQYNKRLHQSSSTYLPNAYESSQGQFNQQNQSQYQDQNQWPLAVIDQLKTVEQFMQVSFQNIDYRLRNVSTKIGLTKHNLAKAQGQKQMNQYQNPHSQIYQGAGHYSQGVRLGSQNNYQQRKRL